MKKKAVVYYVSSHGYGHAARASQVIRELLNAQLMVYVKTKAPEWLFTRIIGKKPEIDPVQVDVGCLQSNNFDVDIFKTINAYRKQSEKNRLLIEPELSFIKEKKISLVVSDIASFPFLLAKRASLPSLYIGNFTWKGIYQHYLDDENHPVIDQLRKEYNMAADACITPLSMAMPELDPQRNIELISSYGKNIREVLNKRFTIPPENKLVFFYSGNRGIERVEPQQVEQIAGFSFISFYSLAKAADNFITLPSDGSFRHQDIMASSDIALVKPGYGMVSEAMVNSVPIVYPPREDFVEYYAFVDEFKRSGGTVQISRKNFETGNWEEQLVQAGKREYKRRYEATGASECMKRIVQMII